MAKTKKVLMEVKNRQICALVVSMLFVLNVASLAFADYEHHGGQIDRDKIVFPSTKSVKDSVDLSNYKSEKADSVTNQVMKDVSNNLKIDEASLQQTLSIFSSDIKIYNGSDIKIYNGYGEKATISFSEDGKSYISKINISYVDLIEKNGGNLKNYLTKQLGIPESSLKDVPWIQDAQEHLEKGVNFSISVDLEKGSAPQSNTQVVLVSLNKGSHVVKSYNYDIMGGLIEDSKTDKDPSTTSEKIKIDTAFNDFSKAKDETDKANKAYTDAQNDTKKKQTAYKNAQNDTKKKQTTYKNAQNGTKKKQTAYKKAKAEAEKIKKTKGVNSKEYKNAKAKADKAKTTYNKALAKEKNALKIYNNAKTKENNALITYNNAAKKEIEAKKIYNEAANKLATAEDKYNKAQELKRLESSTVESTVITAAHRVRIKENANDIRGKDYLEIKTTDGSVLVPIDKLSDKEKNLIYKPLIGAKYEYTIKLNSNTFKTTKIEGYYSSSQAWPSDTKKSYYVMDENNIESMKVETKPFGNPYSRK